MNEKFGTVESITIVSEAILENKKPGIKVDPESDNLWLNAAIVLANEIVAISFSSA